MCRSHTSGREGNTPNNEIGKGTTFSRAISPTTLTPAFSRWDQLLFSGTYWNTSRAFALAGQPRRLSPHELASPLGLSGGLFLAGIEAPDFGAIPAEPHVAPTAAVTLAGIDKQPLAGLGRAGAHER